MPRYEYAFPPPVYEPAADDFTFAASEEFNFDTALLETIVSDELLTDFAETDRQFKISSDLAAFAELAQLADTNPEAAALRQPVLLSLIDCNIITTAGERYNLPISRFQYHIKNGQMFHELAPDKPFLEVVKRGAEIGAGTVDEQRLAAEVRGFENISAVLSHPATPNGTTVISLSPHGEEGTLFTKNFADVFVKHGSVVDTVRLNVSKDIPELIQLANQLSGSNNFPAEATDADFLAQPLVFYPAAQRAIAPVKAMVWNESVKQYTERIEYNITEAEITQMFSVEGDISEAFFAEHVVPQLQKGAERYKIAVQKQPPDIVAVMEAFNYTLNTADEIVFGPQPEAVFSSSSLRPSLDEFAYFAHREVRTIAAGCGISAGYDLSQGTQAILANYALTSSQRYSAFDLALDPITIGMSESNEDEGFGVDRYGSRRIYCCECKSWYARPYNTLLPSCTQEITTGNRKGQLCGNTKGIRC